MSENIQGEQELDLNELLKIRREKLQELHAKNKDPFEITKFVRNETDAIEAQNMSNNLFASNQINKDNAPTIELELAENEIGVLDLLLNAKFVTSKGEARRLIEQNGISMDGETITDVQLRLTKQQLIDGALFKKGKKNYLLIKVK